jgi:hypothetical protein
MMTWMLPLLPSREKQESSFPATVPSKSRSQQHTAAGHYNIFLVDNWNKSDFKQITQLTNVRFGKCPLSIPVQYTHFTFVSDENGINNRYAGFFRSGKSRTRHPGIHRR